jgi:hypothetical protein
LLVHARVDQALANWDHSDLLQPVNDSEATHSNLPLDILAAVESELLDFPPLPSPNYTDKDLSSPKPLYTQNNPPFTPNNSHSPIPPNPPPFQIPPMATITPLPARNSRNAPKFDPDYEEGLPAFFEEFEESAIAAGIDTDDAKMKKEVLRYIHDATTMRFWKSLATFKDQNKSWDEFKQEVIENYPGADQPTEYTEADLSKVVSSYHGTHISNGRDLAKYHREFSIIASSLAENGVMSGLQLGKYYVSVFPDALKSRLDTRLQVKYPNKKKGETYTLSELKESIDFLLTDTSTPVQAGNFNAGSRSLTPATATNSNSSIKTESNDAGGSLKEEVASLRKLVQQFMSLKDPKKTEKSWTCPWDGCTSKSLQECPDLKTWVETGKVV